MEEKTLWLTIFRIIIKKLKSFFCTSQCHKLQVLSVKRCFDCVVTQNAFKRTIIFWGQGLENTLHKGVCSCS